MCSSTSVAAANNKQTKVNCETEITHGETVGSDDCNNVIFLHGSLLTTNLPFINISAFNTVTINTLLA